MQTTVAERYRRLLITSSAQIFIFANLMFDLSYFYAIVADCQTRVRYLFSFFNYCQARHDPTK